MASSFEEARLRNRAAADALARRDALKRAAATRDPQRDTFRETGDRVKHGGRWTAANPDSVFGANANGRASRTT